MKIVCDTNIAISGVLWGGKPNEIMRLAEKGSIEICITFELLQEFEKVIKYPKFQNRIRSLKTTSEEIISFYESIVAVYKGEQLAEQVVKDDPDDDMFISAAMGSGAQIIVSRDTHLLKIQKYREIQILSPDEFLQVFYTFERGK